MSAAAAAGSSAQVAATKKTTGQVLLNAEVVGGTGSSRACRVCCCKRSRLVDNRVCGGFVCCVRVMRAVVVECICQVCASGARHLHRSLQCGCYLSSRVCLHKADGLLRQTCVRPKARKDNALIWHHQEVATSSSVAQSSLHMFSCILGVTESKVLLGVHTAPQLCPQQPTHAVVRHDTIHSLQQSTDTELLRAA